MNRKGMYNVCGARGCLLLLLLCIFFSSVLAFPGQLTPLVSPFYDASSAVNGTVVNVTAPACTTALMLGGCMMSLTQVLPATVSQRWSYTKIDRGVNATTCVFTFSLPANETALGWQLRATSNCM